jgi:hypothetical protein
MKIGESNLLFFERQRLGRPMDFHSKSAKQFFWDYLMKFFKRTIVVVNADSVGKATHKKSMETRVSTKIMKQK